MKDFFKSLEEKVLKTINRKITPKQLEFYRMIVKYFQNNELLSPCYKIIKKNMKKARKTKFRQQLLERKCCVISKKDLSDMWKKHNPGKTPGSYRTFMSRSKALEKMKKVQVDDEKYK